MILHVTTDNALIQKVYFWFLTTREAAWCIILAVYVCLYVCQMITFESLDVRSI